ncbi:MAG: hypothetical protein QOD65_1053 [Gaiellales bacterium]|jgi:hypothetical protein|nr:hypothetical protein [Gaiellales bacterium]MEA2168276.1 hypothetical protein [Solirubrobacteraceae bacterium]
MAENERVILELTTLSIAEVVEEIRAEVRDEP